MAELDNETICILLGIFVVIMIFMFMGRSNNSDMSSPCGNKVATRFQNLLQNNPISGTSQEVGGVLGGQFYTGNQPLQVDKVMSPRGVASGYVVDFNVNNPISGQVGNTGGGQMFMNKQNTRVDTQFIYPPDISGQEKYITEFGSEKGINGVSGLQTDSYLPVYGNPFSMRIVPSQSLNKN